MFLLSLTVAAQDLGSSNKLFGTPKKTSTKKTTAKKPVPKHVAVEKARSAPQKSRAKTPKVARRVKPLPVAKPFPQTPVRDVPVSAASAELYERLIAEGNRSRDERNYTAAEAAYSRAKGISPRDARAVYGLANIYSDQQRWDDAETAYRAALELDPGNAVVYIALSYVLSQPIFVADLSSRYEEAEKLSRHAIQLAPKNALAFDQLGVSMELRGLIGRETEDAYRNAIRLDASFAPAYAHLGRLLHRRGLADESNAAYENAVRYATDVGTLILVADVMQSEQRFADSEPLLRKAIGDDGRNPAALLLLGRALTATAKYDEAESVLRHTLDVSPNCFMADLLLGSLYSRQGKYEQAENALLQALRFVTHNEKRNLSQQFEAVGDGYMKNGKARNAERAYRQALALDAEKDALADKLARAQQHG